MNVYVRELSRHLGARGAAVDVFTRRQAADVAEIVEFGLNARVIHLPAGPERPLDRYKVLDHLPQFVGNIAEFRRREHLDYDVVHGHYWLSAPVARELSLDWSVPLVSMFHTLGKMKNHVSRNGHERENTARIEVEQEAVDVADRLVAASPTDMLQLMGYYHAQPRKIWMIPEGVDTALFRPLDRSASRASVGFGEEPQVLFVGRIQQLKGIDLLLRAFALLSRDEAAKPLPRLTIVGGGRRATADPETAELRRLMALASSLGVENRVAFRDSVPHDELPQYYSAADVVVVPSTYESFGLVALEAMACGTPVVASRVGGLQWTVRDGETGFLIRQRTPEAFAKAIGIVLNDASVRSRMADAAMTTAATYSWGGVADKILEMYAGLLPSRCEGLVSSTR